VPVDRRLEVLAPAFRRKIDAVLEAVPYATVAETLRTDARQQFLYGFGRDYDDGRGIVTHTLASSSCMASGATMTTGAGL